MRVFERAKDVTADGSTDPVALPFTGALELEGVFQTEFEGGTGTGSVTLQGRIRPQAPWVNILTHTASNAGAVVLFPEVRVTFENMAGSATINCWLGE